MIKEIIGLVLIVLGTLVFVIGTVGAFRLDYVMNRMHAAALGDTLGILLIAAGAAVLIFELFTALKLLLLVLSLWLTSPISSYLITKVETLTARHLRDHLETASGHVDQVKEGDQDGIH